MKNEEMVVGGSLPAGILSTFFILHSVLPPSPYQGDVFVQGSLTLAYILIAVALQDVRVH